MHLDCRGPLKCMSVYYSYFKIFYRRYLWHKSVTAACISRVKLTFFHCISLTFIHQTNQFFYSTGDLSRQGQGQGSRGQKRQQGQKDGQRRSQGDGHTPHKKPFKKHRKWLLFSINISADCKEGQHISSFPESCSIIRL